MVIVTNTERLASRYAPYIDELQEFFDLHHFHHGTPDDLVFLANRLSTADDFTAELSSITRSFIFRENCALPPTELLGIVAVAIAGPNVEDFAGELQGDVRTIFHFLSEVARARVDQPPDSRREVDAPEIIPEPIASDPFEYRSHDPVHSLVPKTSSPGNHSKWPLAVAALLVILSFAGWAVKHSHGASIQSATNHASPPPVLDVHRPSAAFSGPIPGAQQSASRVRKSSVSDDSVTGTQTSSRTQQQSPESEAATRSPDQVSGRASEQFSQPDQRHASEAPLAVTSTATYPQLNPAGSPHMLTSTPAGSARVSATRGSFVISSGVMAGHLLSAPEPQYPKLASLTHVEGQVMLQAVVSRDGSVGVARVLSGHRLLRGAAINAVRQWRYRPYFIHGHAVDIATIITVNFRLHH